MKKITINEIVEAVGGHLLQHGSENFINGVGQDSRECGKGDLFIAVVGENQDGHRYIPQALENGSRTFLVSDKDFCMEATAGSDVNIISVEDTVYALGELARYYLSTLDVIKVAVTGSVGKTSVRDMIYYVLSEKYNCGRNMKNFNNFIGLPLSVFQFDDDTEVVVLEMGMDRFGEIDRLGDIVKPNVAVITNIGLAHIENLRSREGIFKAKMEIGEHITPFKNKCKAGCRNDSSEMSGGREVLGKDVSGPCAGGEGALLFAYDGEFLTKETTLGEYRQVSIGEDGKSDYIISSVDDFGLDGIQFMLEHLHRSRKIKVPVPGRHNAVNAALAAAVGELMGVDNEDIQSGLSKVELTGSRLKVLEGKTVNVIDDTYNASPASMKSALKVLEQSRSTGKRIAVLGDMYELGDESLRQHFGVGAFAGLLNIDTVIAIGEDAAEIARGAGGRSVTVAYYEKKQDFYDEMHQYIDFGDIILVKGSRGMKMEQVVEKLLEF